jgi:hypothetical protein
VIQRTTKRLSLRALVVDDELSSPTAEGRAARALVEELRQRNLRALSSWDRRFPGFGHDTHGIENRDGMPHVQCLLPRHEVNAA